MRPFDRYPQPRIAAAPPAGPYQHIMLPFIQETAVQLLYIISNQLVIGSRIAFRLHVDHIADIFHNTMSQGIFTLQQQLVIRYLGKIFIKSGLHINHRTNLKQIEDTALGTRIEVNSKLNLYRTPHFCLSVLLGKLKNACQRKDIMLKDIGKSNQLTAARIDSVTDHHIIRIVGGSNIIEGTVIFGILYGKLQEIKSVIKREVMSVVLQVKRIETGLRFAQGYFHFTGLKHLVRMIRTDTQSQSAVNDILAESQCQTDGTFFSRFVIDRIIVDGTGHSRYGRIITVAILGSDYLLQNNGHLFLVDDVTGGLHVSLAVTIINRSIHTFYRITQHTEHFIFVFQIRNHIGGIDTGKRLVMRILKKTGRTDGYRSFHHIEESKEVFHQTVGKFGFQKGSQNGIIIGIAQSQLIKKIRIHELIKDIGTQHHGLGNNY